MINYQQFQLSQSCKLVEQSGADLSEEHDMLAGRLCRLVPHRDQPAVAVGRAGVVQQVRQIACLQETTQRAGYRISCCRQRGSAGLPCTASSVSVDKHSYTRPQARGGMPTAQIPAPQRGML